MQPGFFDKKKDDVRGDVFALSRLADSGKLHGIEVVVDAKGSR